MKTETRLRKPSEFRRVYKEGRRFVGGFFVLYVYKSSLSKNRLGVSIPKSHFKLATQRNRLRRITKEFFRRKINGEFGNYDFVLSSRMSCQALEKNMAATKLRELLEKFRDYLDDKKSASRNN